MKMKIFNVKYKYMKMLTVFRDFYLICKFFRRNQSLEHIYFNKNRLMKRHEITVLGMWRNKAF